MQGFVKRHARAALTALAIAGGIALSTVATTTPAAAGVSVGIGIGVPGPGYYGPGYYPPGPCAGYNYYYNGDCGYAVYPGPVWLNGAWAYGPHYYRWWGGRPWFWGAGGWHYWGGWGGAHFAWNHGGRWGGGWHGGWHH
jgi:hypothetical protein